MRPMIGTSIRAAIGGVAAVAAMIVLGACSGASHPPGVATARSDSPTASTSGASSQSVQAYLMKRQAVARCYRQHGLPNTKDPDPLGQFLIDFSNPHLKNTLIACEPLSRKVGPVPAQIQQQVEAREAAQLTPKEKKFNVDFAKCMQDNGFPDFPDPLPNGLDATPKWAEPGATVQRPAGIGRVLTLCNAKLGNGPGGNL